MAHLFWKQCLLVTNIAALLVGVVVAPQADNACFFWFATPECSQHRLQCDRGAIFLTQASRGFKLDNNTCRPGDAFCVNKSVCCRNDAGQDCLETYTQAAFSNLVTECWNRQACNHTVQHVEGTNCLWPYTQSSGYSEVQYVCLDNSTIHDFSDSSAIVASSMALRYLSSHGSDNYVCRVTAEDCTNSISEVMLIKWPNTHYFPYCSSLAVTGKEWLTCSKSLSYMKYTMTTPFRVGLYIDNEMDIAQAWAVINAVDSRNLRVECKPSTYGVSFPSCIPPTMAPSTPGPTTPSPGAPGTTPASVPPSTAAPTMAPPSLQPTSQITAAPPSSGKTGTSDNTAAGVQSSTTSSPASGPTSAVTERTMPLSAENTSNKAAVVGGVVGSVAVGLVVVVVVVAIFIIRRRNPTSNPFAKTVAWFKGGNSSRSDGNSGRTAQHITYAQPTSLPVYDNSAVTITDETGIRDADSDYNHLGQKPTSSASRDVTYGHLADGNDVTDYGYDHVTKGKPAARSGNVINNVYNSPGPAAGGPSEEDAYNISGAAKTRPDVINNVYNKVGPATGGDDFHQTTGSAKNRPDVINTVYNTPSPACDASSDVEYYNTAGLPQPGRDVTNTVYDTPRSARPAGDITGADADSPYELARSVK